MTGQVCFAGVAGGVQPCTSTTVTGTKHAADFTQAGGPSPYSAFTIAIALPRDAVRSAVPILQERWSLKKALTPNPVTGALAGAVLLLGAGTVMYLVGTKGRDRRFVGQTPGLVPAPGAPETDERVPLVSRAPVAVAFAPPEWLRPGQIGTLIDERANVTDVTATIVDLAVRGYLRIDELERGHWFTSRDWQLVELRDDEDLLPYEKALFNGLFESGDTVKLSELKKKFAARLTKVQTKLYEDVTRAGWFRGRPDKVRSGWSAVGAVLTIGAGFLAFGLFKLLHWGPVAIAVLLVGLAVLFSARRMPARTAGGTAVQALGFREYIRTAEANQLRFEEEADIFSRYLPYAIVFGEADRWVRVFGPLAAGAAVGAGVGASTGPLWYSAPNGSNSSHFSDSLTGFTSSVSSTIAASTTSSSGGSGFSGGSSGGGGGGGGGGGSW